MSTLILRNSLAVVVSLTALVSALACGSAATQERSPTLTAQSRFESQGVTLEPVFETLAFSRLTNLVQAGDRFFVTEQAGRVIAIEAGSDPTGVSVFLDIRDRVNRGGNEEGLLGLAFDPDFESNGHFYVYYSATNPRRSVVSRFTAAGTADVTPLRGRQVVLWPAPDQPGSVSA